MAENGTNIFFSEIAWMGSENSYADEWIELYNNSDEKINLLGWTLKSDNGLKINLLGEIVPKGFFLLERTDDDTVKDIPSDQIYKGNLGNSGEKITIYDDSGLEIDSLNCSLGWFKGNNSAKQTMERIGFEGLSGPSDWQDSKLPGGTPKNKNSSGAIISSEISAKNVPDLSLATIASETKDSIQNKENYLAFAATKIQFKKSPNSFFFVLPLILSLFSAIMVLFLRRSLS